MTAGEVWEVATPHGPARVHWFRQAGGPGAGCLVLGHGAGGRDWSADLTLLAAELPSTGWEVVLVEQPWRVSGRKVATPPATLDAAWVPVVADVRSRLGPAAQPLVVGGRSAGARVACRTAREVGADAVLCLAFPLHPPGRPERSRAGELAMPSAAGLPVHVVQGRRDPFGSPDEVREQAPPGVSVATVAGAHSFSADPADVLHEVRRALAAVSAAP